MPLQDVPLSAMNKQQLKELTQVMFGIVTWVRLGFVRCRGDCLQGSNRRSPYTGISHFLLTSQKIVQFMDGAVKDPQVRVEACVLALMGVDTLTCTHAMHTSTTCFVLTHAHKTTAAR